MPRNKETAQAPNRTGRVGKSRAWGRRRQDGDAIYAGAGTSGLSRQRGPFMAAAAEAVEVVTASDELAAAVKVYANLEARSAPRAACPMIRERRKSRNVDGMPVHAGGVPPSLAGGEIEGRMSENRSYVTQ